MTTLIDVTSSPRVTKVKILLNYYVTASNIPNKAWPKKKAEIVIYRVMPYKYK